MIKDVWPNDQGHVEQCFRTGGLMIMEVWTNDYGSVD